MDWIQLIPIAAFGLTICVYMTGVCVYLYRQNEKTIAEWKSEHSNQIKEWRSEHKEQMERMDAKWEKLFGFLITQDKQNTKSNRK